MAKPALAMWVINKKLVQGAVYSKDMRGSSTTKGVMVIIMSNKTPIDNNNIKPFKDLFELIWNSFSNCSIKMDWQS